eukprot:CAMPEP_0119367596 /NCGR_PEP_ID=MMETSP1334-20130426/14372_1 /TAXON_ID=127549 /ORGANISM="Calcidiscus leptoporus, Strain RCC1130" /LENGTH=125 /DNA_ID=CAMNT_0007384039 /DNA_START=556 /DNA_END=934 /DNA_ORIENTATION=+
MLQDRRVHPSSSQDRRLSCHLLCPVRKQSEHEHNPMRRQCAESRRKKLPSCLHTERRSLSAPTLKRTGADCVMRMRVVVYLASSREISLARNGEGLASSVSGVDIMSTELLAPCDEEGEFSAWRW